MTGEINRATRVLASVEAPAASWWGYAHSEPTSTARRPPLEQMLPTHVALQGDVPPALLAQAVHANPTRCPCAAQSQVAIVPVDAVWPTGTVFRYTTLGRRAASYADAG